MMIRKRIQSPIEFFERVRKLFRNERLSFIVTVSYTEAGREYYGHDGAVSAFSADNIADFFSWLLAKTAQMVSGVPKVEYITCTILVFQKEQVPVDWYYNRPVLVPLRHVYKVVFDSPKSVLLLDADEARKVDMELGQRLEPPLDSIYFDGAGLYSDLYGGDC